MIYRPGGPSASPRWDRQVTPHQFANDWIMIDTEYGEDIVSPEWCKPTEAELRGMRPQQGVGIFWGMWEIGQDGFFVRR